jgi:hypothetical protein
VSSNLTRHIFDILLTQKHSGLYACSPEGSMLAGMDSMIADVSMELGIAF